VPLGCGLLAGAGGEVNAGFSVRKGEQKVEMRVGDFGPQVSSARRRRARFASASQDGGIVGFGFRSALSRGLVG
jgi:hypothetical protein